MNFTSNMFLNVLLTVIYAIVVIFGFNLLNIYYLKKFDINKWVMLGAAVLTLALALFLVIQDPDSLWHLIPLTLSLSAFMWFMDLRRRSRNKSRKTEKKIVNKPKPNPKRAKMIQNTDGGEKTPTKDKPVPSGRTGRKK